MQKQKIPTWVSQSDRVWAMASLERGDYASGGVWLYDDGGKVWCGQCLDDPRWREAINRYTGDDGPVCLVERECPECDGEGVISGEYICENCEPFGGRGVVYEIVPDVLVDLGAHADKVGGARAYMLQFNIPALRFECDARECKTCGGHGEVEEQAPIYEAGWAFVSAPCRTCDGTGTIPAKEWVIER